MQQITEDPQDYASPHTYIAIPRHVRRADPDRYHLEDWAWVQDIETKRRDWRLIRIIGRYGDYGEAQIRRQMRQEQWPERYLGPDRTHDLRINDTHRRKP